MFTRQCYPRTRPRHFRKRRTIAYKYARVITVPEILLWIFTATALKNTQRS